MPDGWFWVPSAGPDVTAENTMSAAAADAVVLVPE
jgi:hypothetical protein